VYGTQEHYMGNIYAGSILAMDFLAVEETHGESGGSIFVCIKVICNSVAATVNTQGQWKDIPITWNLEPALGSAGDCTGECLWVVWFKQEPICQTVTQDMLEKCARNGMF